MSGQPTGTVTFLFTDIEGSTKRWEANPAAMQAAFARQEAILRQAIDANVGYAYKMIGDAFQAAFPTAPQALQAALDAQYALQSETWPAETGEVRVRMALHTGTTEERGHDYVGPTLNRVARLLSAGHGAQILLSEVTYGLVRDTLPPGTELRDMGEHRLKDLIRPEHVFQLVVPDLPSEFPPLKTLDNQPNNLPVQSTPIIGREKEIEAIKKLVQSETGQIARLVTLTGPGGTGKTRLALQVAADLIDHFADGIFFISLAHITDPTLVAPAIALALGANQVAGREMVDTLGDYLSDKRLLLLPDNFEQVLTAGPLVAKLMQVAPLLKVLVTSREVLHVSGEQEFPVPPLGVPDPKHLPSLELLSQYEAIALFIQRARLAKPDFDITTDNALALAEICYRLDGLPLAIELAAARIRLLPPRALLSRLSSRLRLLTTGARDLPERQQTLRSTIQWSYDLLQPGEQMLFRRMSVFAGGATLEAIEAVCNADGAVQLDVLDGVASLVDKSLVRQETTTIVNIGSGTGGTESEPRFGMLQTIREYGMELLQSHPGSVGTRPAEGDEVYRQHVLYYLALAEQGWEGMRGQQQAEWLDRLDAEHDNLQAALQRAIEGGDADTALRIAGALCVFWAWRGYYNESHKWLNEALRLPGSEVLSRARARALRGIALARELENDLNSARAYVEESIATFRALKPEERGELGIALGEYGSTLAIMGEQEAACAAVEEGISLLRQAGNKWDLSHALFLRGIVANSQGDYATARVAFEESMQLARELGNKWVLSQVSNGLGDVSRMVGEYARAKELYEESLSLYRRLSSRSDIPASLHNLGHVALVQGRVEDAKKLFIEALHLQVAQKSRAGIAECLAGLAGVATAEKHTERAARLFGAAEAIREAVDAPMWPAERQDYERNLAGARAQFGDGPTKESTWEKTIQEGRAMSREEAVEYALEGG